MNDGFFELGCILGIQIIDYADSILSIIGTLIITGIAIYNFILKLKRYSADGKIDAKETEDLLNDVKEITEKVKEIKDNDN